MSSEASMFTPKLTHEFWEKLEASSEILDISCSGNCWADYPKRIRHLDRLIAGIKCHLNAHAWLPPEILGQIFMHYARPVHNDGTHQDDKSYMTLLHIGQVCRYWRRAVLGNPQLWTHIPVHSLPGAASAFLDRSRGLPLTIWGNVPAPPENHNLCPMGNLDIPMEIVQSISFNVAKKPRSRTSKCIFPSQPAPQLRLLRLHSNSDGTPIALSSPPFCGYTPLLDTVILKSVSPSWTWIQTLCGLTTLVIDNPRPVDNVPEDFSMIIAALHKMPNLTRLELCSEQANAPPDIDLGSNEGRHNPNYLGPAVLPHLRRLCLRSFSIGVSYLMARLSFPQSAYVELTSEQFADVGDIQDLSAALARHYTSQLDASSISRPKSLFIQILNPRAFAVHITTDTRPVSNPSHPPMRSLLTLNMPDTEVAAEVMLPKFTMGLLDAFMNSPHACLSFDTLVIDACVADVDFKKCYWMSYPPLSIARIILIGGFVEPFADGFASQVSIEDLQVHEAGCVCLPFLEQLEIWQFDFTSGPRTAFLDLVLGLRQWRMLFGPEQRVLRVCVRDCVVTARQVEDLRAVCDHFEWDGKTGCLDEEVFDDGDEIRW